MLKMDKEYHEHPTKGVLSMAPIGEAMRAVIAITEPPFQSTSFLRANGIITRAVFNSLFMEVEKFMKCF